MERNEIIKTSGVKSTALFLLQSAKPSNFEESLLSLLTAYVIEINGMRK